MIAVVFGALWARDAMASSRAAPPNGEASPLLTEAEKEELAAERYPRNKFLELTTLGLGAVIGGIVTLPILGFAVLPAFTDQEREGVDLGPTDNFPENEWREATYLLAPAQGEVSRRTAFVRYNGLYEDLPSYTIISNRCVHLGCPVQVNGLPIDDDAQIEVNEGQRVRRIPTAAAAGFGCPCHGGQYDNEGNPTAGPPVRALDRYEFEINDGRLLLGDTYSVSEVDGTGAEAQIHAYPLMGPGQHVDGPSSLLYPVEPPN